MAGLFPYQAALSVVPGILTPADINTAGHFGLQDVQWCLVELVGQRYM